MRRLRHAPARPLVGSEDWWGVDLPQSTSVMSGIGFRSGDRRHYVLLPTTMQDRKCSGRPWQPAGCSKNRVLFSYSAKTARGTHSLRAA